MVWAQYISVLADLRPLGKQEEQGLQEIYVTK